MSILWLVLAYGLAFGDGGGMNQFVGLGKFFLDGVGWDSLTGDIPESVFFMFQMTFAIITPALIVGGFAERMKFSAVLWFSCLWLLLVYAPVCHWVWGGGWLGDMGFMDFAGGTVVHINAGVAAVVAAMVLGNRKGFPGAMMPPHNMTLTVAGASMLWVGWFGFNAAAPWPPTPMPAWPCWLRISLRQRVPWPGLPANGLNTASPAYWASSPVWWQDWARSPRLRVSSGLWAGC